MKKTTRHDYAQTINKVLYHIHLNISQNLDIKSLAKLACMSPFHFSRVFKKTLSQSPHSYIKRVRLEHSANALLFNPNSTISEILIESGFTSNSSFTHAFKEHFKCTPTKWREVDIKEDINNNMTYCEPLHVEICYFKPRSVAYVRHKGYDKSIKNAWNMLENWATLNHLNFSNLPMIGLHHSNPNILKKEECHYVACIEIEKNFIPCISSLVGIMQIPKIFCAKFSLKGEYGDLMKYMNYIYYGWLPNSKYEKIHLPALALYHKNHFTDDDEKFELDFYVPIRYI